LISESQVKDVNKRISDLLTENNVNIDAFYYCPAHPEFSTAEECECRKPSSRMIMDAAKEFNIDLEKSYIIGDSLVDIESGMNAGIKTILVKTGQGAESISMLQNQNKFPSFVAENIIDASNFIVKDLHGDN